MAPNKLSEKLNHLSEEDLGLAFDEAAIWSKLEQKLDNRSRYTFWWVAAACLLAALVFFPIGLLETSVSEHPIISDKLDIPAENVQTSPIEEVSEESMPVQEVIAEFKNLNRKGIAPIAIAAVSDMKLHLTPITLSIPEEKPTSLFAAEDISIIQASLEQSSVEKGRTVSIRAQWQKSPDELNVNYQALKIKLYEKEKKQ